MAKNAKEASDFLSEALLQLDNVLSATRVHSFSGSRETGHVRSRSLPSAVPKVVSLLSDLHTVLQKCDDKEALKQTIPRDVMTGVQHWLIPSPDDYRSSKVRIQQLSQ
uniref:Uncharacterized protein n=1 Tax=Magallana gigas TaxID=29159 RepID=A0A8W8NJM4_MAGGI